MEKKGLAKITEQYWFPDKLKLVRKFVQNCAICRFRKGISGAKQIRLNPIDKINVPLHVDITPPRRINETRLSTYAFVFIDSFTKYVHLVYIETAIKC